jgi:hypothetical protein
MGRRAGAHLEPTQGRRRHNFKGWLRGTFHGVSHKHLPRYLQEFVYRTNRRWLEHDLFFYVLRRAVQGNPLPWARLTAEAAE